MVISKQITNILPANTLCHLLQRCLKILEISIMYAMFSLCSHTHTIHCHIHCHIHSVLGHFLLQLTVL